MSSDDEESTPPRVTAPESDHEHDTPPPASTKTPSRPKKRSRVIVSSDEDEDEGAAAAAAAVAEEPEADDEEQHSSSPSPVARVPFPKSARALDAGFAARFMDHEAVAGKASDEEGEDVEVSADENESASPTTSDIAMIDDDPELPSDDAPHGNPYDETTVSVEPILFHGSCTLAC
jgi:hypothetical protein